MRNILCKLIEDAASCVGHVLNIMRAIVRTTRYGHRKRHRHVLHQVGDVA